MTKKEIKIRIKEVLQIQDEGEKEIAANNLIDELFKEKRYREIVEIYTTLSEFLYSSFEIALSLHELGRINESESMYEEILIFDSDNTAVLNNLSNIKKQKGDKKEAFKLIEKAYELSKDDEIITRNYRNLLAEIKELEDIEQNYKYSLIHLEKENEFVLNKLKTFITNFMKERDINNGVLPIPAWKFKILMGTDEVKSESLKKQWLDKGYIRKLNKRNEYNVSFYELNPFLEKHILSVKAKTLNRNWIEGIENLTTEKLEEINYFSNQAVIQRVSRKFKLIIERDFNELVFNHLIGNYKTVIVLSGSITETCLIYLCEKKGIKTINYTINGKTVNKDLYSADLGDLLSYMNETKMLKGVLVHMGNMSRIYRNFVHPGKELRGEDTLSKPKADICFLTTCELLSQLLAKSS